MPGRGRGGSAAVRRASPAGRSSREQPVVRLPWSCPPCHKPRVGSGPRGRRSARGTGWRCARTVQSPAVGFLHCSSEKAPPVPASPWSGPPTKSAGPPPAIAPPRGRPRARPPAPAAEAPATMSPCPPWRRWQSRGNTRSLRQPGSAAPVILPLTAAAKGSRTPAERPRGSSRGSCPARTRRSGLARSSSTGSHPPISPASPGAPKSTMPSVIRAQLCRSWQRGCQKESVDGLSRL
mmetsp:Transcript_11746/g.32095  ORF Transcript_11746/g.32095 Transcript_11746/m.32095 type:complete len:236 (-) Transcript_11746:668-1375(-)